MRICFLIYGLGGGGAERVTVGLASHWARSGHDVTIVAWGATGAGSEQAYTLDPRVRVEWLGLGADAQSRQDALIANWRRLAAVRTMLNVHRPDVAIAMMHTSSVLLALAPGQKDTIRIGTERVYPPFSETSLLWRLARPLAYRRLAAVVAQTIESGDWLRRRTLARRVAVIANPYQCQGRTGPDIAPSSLLPRGSKLCLAVGRLSWQKQYDRLVEVFAEVAAPRPEWHLCILGEGSERAQLERIRASTACPERIHFVGRVGNVEKWLEHARIFVMSSRYEGFPNALLEAYCSGVPSISFDCPSGPSTIITSGEDGILVKGGDFQSLGVELGSLMDNGQLGYQLASRAASRAGKFSVAAIAGEWEELFQDLKAKS